MANFLPQHSTSPSILLVCSLLAPPSFGDTPATPTAKAEYPPGTRTITVTGTIDPRLSAWVRNHYTPTDYDPQDRNCTSHRDWNTGDRKAALAVQLEEIKPDANNHYTVTLPIDYIKDNKCGYKYVDSVLNIRRDNKDELFASITLLSESPRPLNKYGNPTTREHSGFDSRTLLKITSPHYRLANNTRIECHTDYFESRQGVSFTCIPLGGNGKHGTNQITSTDLNVDIVINEEVSIYYRDILKKKNYRELIQQGLGSKKDHFRDYTPPPTFLETIKQKLEQFFNVGAEQ